MQRYLRQTIVPQVGAEGQRRLLGSRALVVGAGGLGHPVAQYLAGMGVGEIHIVDGDQIHITNLHRQILFRDSDIGKNKALVLADQVGKMNPDARVVGVPSFLDKKLALEMISKVDVVVDCTDHFESKFLLNDVCVYYRVPLVYGAVSQWEGQVGVFWNSRGSCYRCLYSRPPRSPIENCSEAGVVGAIVGALGSLQALEVLKVLVDRPQDIHPLIGRVNYYDWLGSNFRSLQVPQKPQCFCTRALMSPESIEDIPIRACVAPGTALLVDVRERDEWNEYHVEGSVHLPLSQIEAGALVDLENQREIILICRSGARARRAQEILSQKLKVKVTCSLKGVYEY
jgi:adenylyltransferase/sulfurtransferase